MKSLTGRMLMIAAAMTVVTAVASAQNMKAEIPFSFRVAEKVMPAGSYMVSRGGTHLIQVSNRETRHSALAIAVHELDTATGNAPSKLVFVCSGGPCTLTQVWRGNAGPAQQLNSPKRGQELAKVIEVRLERAAD